MRFKFSFSNFILAGILIGATALAGNSTFIQGPTLIESLSTTATAGGTTQLTVASNTNQEFTGSANQTVKLPNATTVKVGRRFNVHARSTGTVTLQDFDGNTLWTSVATGNVSVVALTVATTAGTWSVESDKISLDKIQTPAADAAITMANKTLTWNFTNPSGGMGWNFTGAAAGHSLEIMQSGGNPGADMHLLHIEAEDADPTALHLTPGSATSTALKVNTTGENTGPGRFNINASGKQTWGNGTDAVDSDLARTGAGMLSTSGALAVGTASAPDAKAVLDASSTTKGFLPPRMTEAQRDAITSPTEGLIIYNTTSKKTNNFDGTDWVEVGSGTGGGGSGGNNFLANEEFETGVTSWTGTTITPAAEATTIFKGAGSMKMTFAAQTGNVAQSVTPPGSTAGVNLENSCWVKTALTTIQVCSLLAGVEQQCVDVPSSNTWQKIVATSVGAASSTSGVEIKTTASTTGDVFVDDCYVGPNRNIGTVAQAEIVVQATRSANLSAANNSATKIQYNTERKDVYGEFDPATNYRFMAKRAGAYSLTGSVYLAATTATVDLRADIYKNGAAVAYKPNSKSGATSLPSSIHFEHSLDLVAGDYVEIYLYQSNSASSALTIAGDDTVPYLTALTIKRFPTASEMAITMDQQGGTVLRAPKTSGSHTSSGSWQDVVWDAATFNGGGGTFDGTTYTIPRDGKYIISGAVGYALNTGGTGRGAKILKGATVLKEAVFVPMATYNPQAPFYDVVDCVKGDTIKIQGFQDSSGTLAYSTNTGYSNLTIQQISSTQSAPLLVETTHSVAQYSSSSTSLTTGTITTLLFVNKNLDTDNAYNTSTGLFTCPTTGIYEGAGRVILNTGGGWGATEEANLYLYKNSAIAARIGGTSMEATHSTYVQLSSTPAMVQCNAGETLSIRAMQNSGGTIAVLGGDEYSFATFKRVR